MRINIEVPLPSGSRSNTASSAPPTIVKLSPSGELVLIELQGSLEIDDAHPEGGQALGKLEFHKSLEVRSSDYRKYTAMLMSILLMSCRIDLLY
jgi:hypothetical protein